MCGGGGEGQVTSIESHGQPDAGWLAAPLFYFAEFLLKIILLGRKVVNYNINK